MGSKNAFTFKRPNASLIGKEIFHFDEIRSTNLACKDLISLGFAKDGMVVSAGSQTEGRGRFERRWESPKDDGIYFSILLKPGSNIKNIEFITSAFSLSVAKTIEEMSGLKPSLKWPNDIFINSKKVAGILAEKKGEFLIAGIGLNLNTSSDSLGDEISKFATSLKIETGRLFDKESFMWRLLENIEKNYVVLSEQKVPELLEEYKEISRTLGGNVKIKVEDGFVEGKALDIDASGALLVEGPDGKIFKITSGDNICQ